MAVGPNKSSPGRRSHSYNLSDVMEPLTKHFSQPNIFLYTHGGAADPTGEAVCDHLNVSLETTENRSIACLPVCQFGQPELLCKRWCLGKEN
ncbi:hypothetical protein AMECASPLE_038161 [Ameca splendens]|uniref:Uncharacterized protein n=1 Tax=Ameca splendens TaxID=208324 RepID=A0ABV0Y7Z3_9TELE